MSVRKKCEANKTRYSKVVPGVNDLFTVCPEAEIMWDYEKNSNINPRSLLPGSSHRVSFKCLRGHAFMRQIYTFTTSPYCKVCYLMDNNITKTNPELMKWWDYERNKGIDPQTLFKTSSKKVWWKCPKCSYGWQAEVASRVTSKGQCPCCETRIVVVPGINDMFSLVPNSRADYDYEKNKDIDASKIMISSQKPLWWKCHICSYSWKTSPSVRIQVGNDGTYKLSSCSACKGTVRLIPFYEEYPKLAEKYDSNMNEKPLSAFKISSKKLLWWKCPKCNKLFQSIIRAMIRSYNTYAEGCPYCAGKKVIREKSFGYLHPDVLDEYDPMNSVDPFQVMEGSTRKVSWICRENLNHRWYASFINRAKGYGSCPICKKYNYNKMLYQERPDLEPFYDTEKNERIFKSFSCFSNESVYWKCEKGHSYKKTIVNVVKSDELYCPICKNLKLLKGVNDLLSQYPNLAKEYDNIKNKLNSDEVTISSSSKKTWWKCSLGHSYQASVSYRIKRGQGCPVCNRQIVLAGFNDLKHRYPDIDSIWDFQKNKNRPEDVLDTTSKELYFRCDKGHSYTASSRLLSQYGCKCLVCADKVLQRGYNTFADYNPGLVKEWSLHNEDTPWDISPTSSKYRFWICPKCNGEYQAPVKMRKLNDNGCPYCNSRKVLPGYNSVADKRPELLPEWAPDNELTPSEVIAESSYVALWSCSECHGKYRHPVRLKKYGNEDCPYCNNRKLLPGFNSIADKRPELLSEWAPDNELTPSEVIAESSYVALWNCSECHGKYHHPVRLKKYGNEDCPYCNNRKILQGYNSLKVKCIELMIEWDYQNNYLIANPDNLLPNSNEEVWWKCLDCSTKYKMSPKQRLYYKKRKMKSCPFCKGRRRKKHYYF